METIKGFSDYTGEIAQKRAKIKKIIEETFELYGFEPAETPVIENEEFVKGNNTNDAAVSERYSLEDKGKRKLALRYEFTFQLKRLANNKKLPYRRYQIGYVFRDEPIGGNRVRQITQCDIDIIGSTIKDEAEILKAFSELLNKLGIEFTILFNNRKLLNEVLDELKVKDKEEVIRELDKLDKLKKEEVKENLKKYNAEKALEVFLKPEKYFEKYNAFKEIQELKNICKDLSIEIVFVPYLARGLAYYNGTVIEIKTKKIKETICGGGSYLVNGLQSTGISASIERLQLLANIDLANKRVLIISLNQDKRSNEISDKIRQLNIPCNIFFGKPTKALEYANSNKIPYVIFIGDEEIKNKTIKLKNMTTGKESMIKESELSKSLI